MSRRPERIDAVLAVLRYAWGLNPDERLGQLLHNVTREGWDLWNMEDRDLMRCLIDDIEVTEKHEAAKAWAAFSTNVTPTIISRFKKGTK